MSEGEISTLYARAVTGSGRRHHPGELFYPPEETNTHIVDLTALGLQQFLQGHHHAFEVDNSEEVVHVYAIGGHPVFSEGTSSYDFDIEFGFAGLVWILKGAVNLSTFAINASFSVRIPILGTFTLAKVNGSLVTGVSITFGVSGILSGTAKFYIKQLEKKWIYVDLSATVFGKTYGPISIGLIPLP